MKKQYEKALATNLLAGLLSLVTGCGQLSRSHQSTSHLLAAGDSDTEPTTPGDGPDNPGTSPTAPSESGADNPGTTPPAPPESGPDNSGSTPATPTTDDSSVVEAGQKLTEAVAQFRAEINAAAGPGVDPVPYFTMEIHATGTPIPSENPPTSNEEKTSDFDYRPRSEADFMVSAIGEAIAAFQKENVKSDTAGDPARNSHSPQIAPLSPQNYPYQTPFQSEDGHRLAQVWQYKNAAASSIDPNDVRAAHRHQIISAVDAALHTADEAFTRGARAEAAFLLKASIVALDIAVSISPVGWAKFGYEAITGRNALTGENLNPVSRGIAITVFTVSISAMVATAEVSVPVLTGVELFGSLLKSLRSVGAGEVSTADAASQAAEAIAESESTTDRIVAASEEINSADINPAEWKHPDGTWRYAGNKGFQGVPRNETQPVGTRLDRYGPERGEYLAPQGTSFGQRALPPSTDLTDYHVYEVIKPLPVQVGPAAPCFGQPGGGIQIYTGDLGRVADLLGEYLKEVTP